MYAIQFIVCESNGGHMQSEHKDLMRISDDQIDANLKTLASQERKIHKGIILHIAEVNRRKLFLKKSYPNIFVYLTEYIGLSRGTAQRGLDSAKLSLAVPNVVDQIEDGTLSLSQIATLQQ